MSAVEGKAKESVTATDKSKRPWSLRKKLLIFGGAALLTIIVIGLAVGLGVGLTRDGGSDDGDDDQQDGSGGAGGAGGNEDEQGLPDNGPDRDSVWKPKVNSTWQIVLKSPIDLESEKDDSDSDSDSGINPDVAIYDLDLYDNDMDTFRTLQSAGKKVICYFSAGSWEDWREDKDEFDEDDLGEELDGWPDERWLNISSPSVRNIIKKRIEVAWRKGCDAIDPDNVDGFQNENGLGLTADDSVDFMRFLSDEAKSHKMAIGLKNAGSIIPDVIDFIDFSVNEQCIEYSECETFADFIDAGKPVFNIEYPKSAPDVASDRREAICSGKGDARGSDGFSTVIKKMNLDGWVEYCDGKTFTTNLLT